MIGVNSFVVLCRQISILYHSCEEVEPATLCSHGAQNVLKYMSQHHNDYVMFTSAGRASIQCTIPLNKVERHICCSESSGINFIRAFLSQSAKETYTQNGNGHKCLPVIDKVIHHSSEVLGEQTHCTIHACWGEPERAPCQWEKWYEGCVHMKIRINATNVMCSQKFVQKSLDNIQMLPDVYSLHKRLPEQFTAI